MLVQFEIAASSSAHFVEHLIVSLYSFAMLIISTDKTCYRRSVLMQWSIVAWSFGKEFSTTLTACAAQSLKTDVKQDECLASPNRKKVVVNAMLRREA